jgi:uncharacterized membrane protein YfcA
VPWVGFADKGVLLYDARYLSWIRFCPTLAVGTSLVAAILAAASGARQHWRLADVDWKSVKHIAPAGVAGVLASSAFFYYIREYGAAIGLVVGLALKATFGSYFPLCFL